MNLSADHRVRLDARVDSEALEAFLGRFPMEYHWVIINGCLKDPEPGLGSVVQFMDPAAQRDWLALWGRNVESESGSVRLP
jgi:hypothetical protein